MFPETEIVSNADGSLERYTYGVMADRVPALAAGLAELGIGETDRVGTLCWNHHRHYEAYFALPLRGAQLHTINFQLPDRDIEYIVNDTADELLLVDSSMVETVERL